MSSRRGGSSLSVAGALTNTGTPGYLTLGGSVTAKSFVNSGTVESERRNGAIWRTLNVSGATDQQRLDFDRH